MTVFHLWYLRCEGNVLYFFPTYVRVILGWFSNKENIFKQLQCKDILGMDREIVFVLKELEIWSIISWTIHICNKFHNFLGTFTFFISTELHNTLKRAKRYHLHLVSVHFSHSVMSDSLQPHELQHFRPPCPSQTPGVHPNPCPLCWWCHPTILSSAASPYPPALNLSQHQGLFRWVSFSHQVAKVLEFQLQPSVLPMDI